MGGALNYAFGGQDCTLLTDAGKELDRKDKIKYSIRLLKHSSIYVLSPIVKSTYVPRSDDFMSSTVGIAASDWPGIARPARAHYVSSAETAEAPGPQIFNFPGNVNNFSTAPRRHPRIPRRRHLEFDGGERETTCY